VTVRLVLATRNAHKQREFARLLPEHEIEALPEAVALPPETGDTFMENALGKDPGNALLQELLVNTYQDEMRVLTDVHYAGDAGRGI